MAGLRCSFREQLKISDKPSARLDRDRERWPLDALAASLPTHSSGAAAAFNANAVAFHQAIESFNA